MAPDVPQLSALTEWRVIFEFLFLQLVLPTAAGCGSDPKDYSVACRARALHSQRRLTLNRFPDVG